MPISPLTILFPIGVIAAIVAAALGETKAEASQAEPVKRRLTREEWEADKQGWFNSFGPNLNCQPGYKIVWNDYDGSPATFVCKALPVVKPVATARLDSDCQPGYRPSQSDSHICEPIPVATARLDSDCQPGYRPSQSDSHICEPIPVATDLVDTRPQILPSPPRPATMLIPGAVSQKPSATIPTVTLQTPSGHSVEVPRVVSVKEYEADKKRKAKKNNCGPGMEPKFLPYNQSWAEYKCEPSAASILSAKQDEHKETERRSTIREISKDEAANLENRSISVKPAKSPKKVSLAEWQADQKRKMRDNNCEDGFSPKFNEYQGNWAEYKCEPSGVAKVLTQKSEPQREAVKAPVQASTIKEVKTVQKAVFEPEAAPYVSDALKSKDSQKIVDVADAIDSQYPNAAMYLRAEAPKYTMVFEPDVVTLKNKKTNASSAMVFEPDVVTLKSKKPDSKASQTKVAKVSEPAHALSPVAAALTKKESSKKEREAGKVYDKKLASEIEKMKIIGEIEPESIEKIAIFYSKNPSAAEARSFAQNFKSKSGAYNALHNYADIKEGSSGSAQHLAKQEAKGEPTEPKKVVEAANATKNPAKLLAHATTLDATGNPKTADKIRARAKEEAKKQGVTILDDNEAAKLVAEAESKQNNPDELKRIKKLLLAGNHYSQSDYVDMLLLSASPSAEKKLKEVKRVADVQAANPSAPAAPATDSLQQKQAVQQKKVDDKKASTKPAKESNDKAKTAAQAVPEHFKSEEDFFQSLDDEKLGDADKKKKAKKSGSVSGEDYSSLSSEGAAHPSRTSVSSPIDGVDDRRWVAFVNAMKVGKAQTITPSYALGMFGFGARRLADYGLMDNPRQTEYHGNTVWAGEWSEPWDLETFLSDGEAQYKLFESDLAAKAEYIRENEAEGKQVVGQLVEGRPATLSGLLAVAFKTTENSFNHWLSASHEERMKFPATMQLFQKANGIF